VVREIELRLDAFVGTGSWTPVRSPVGNLVVEVGGSSKNAILRVDMDLDRATDGDVAFTASAKADVAMLLDAVLARVLPPTPVAADEMSGRASGATPGPWLAFLEEEGAWAETASFEPAKVTIST
jgi:hypothetical protein